jgi:hypothetical protein
MLLVLVLWMFLKFPTYNGPSKIIKVNDEDEFFEIIGENKDKSKKDFSKCN